MQSTSLLTKNKIMEKKYSMFVGIDVSKLKLDVWLMSAPDSKQDHFIVPNTEKGIKEIIQMIKKKKTSINDCLFCFENTGIYSMPLSFSLSQLKADYWIVPAFEIKCSKGISRGKNDKNDSKDIAFYAYTHLHKLKLSKLPEKEIMELKLLFTEREKLLKVIKIIATTSEIEDFVPNKITKEAIKINTKTVSFLKVQLKEVEIKMSKIVKENEKINAQVKLIKSVPGIGINTSMYLVITTKCFDSFKNWRKLACYAGIAPFEYSSGSSVRGKTKVNHLADKKLKSMMQMCVLTAVKNDPEIKAYYNRKKNEGKNSMLVMNNIRCKLVARAFAVINRGTPFVNTQKFAA